MFHGAARAPPPAGGVDGCAVCLASDVLPQLRFVYGATQIAVSLHGLCIVAGVVIGMAIALRRARERALVLVALPPVVVAGLAGSRALFAALHGGSGFWSGGLSSSGGVAAGILVAAVVAKARGRPVADVLGPLAPAAIVALGVGRVGCFLGGCCYGRPTALPWGVVFPEVGPPPRHPLQLYSAAGDLVLAAILLARGTSLAGACIGLGVLRFGLECLRDPATTDLLPGDCVTLPQAAALALVAGAACLRGQGASTMAPPRRTRADGG